MRWPLAQRLARIAGAATIAATAGGCALNSEDISAAVMTDPLKYELYDCKQMEGQMKALVAQADRFKDLIAKAEQGPGGTIVATVAYKNDYLRVRADIKNLRESQQRRNCIKQTERDGIAAVH